MRLASCAARRPRGGWPRLTRGQAIVEMALVIMLLLILTFGIADMGLFMYRNVQAANCVREAARRAAVRDDLAGADNLCVDSGLKDELVIDPAGYATLEAGEPVTASLDVEHDWIVIGSLIPGLGDSVQISAAETMRMEGQIQDG